MSPSNNETAARTDGAGGPPERKLVVILDTDPGVRWAVSRGLERSGYRVRVAGTPAEAAGIAQAEPVEAVVMELLPEAGVTQEAISLLVDAASKPQVVCVSADAGPQIVIECLRRGAADFLTKPFGLDDLRQALARALASETQRPAIRFPGISDSDSTERSLLIGISPCIQELRATIEQVAKTDLNCLLRGESGTGKDLVAREIHRRSRRADRPFVKVNCTALPEALLESELFGYEKGAFSGAVASKPGRFELAHKGMIFLDEIGEMHPNLQSKLLQVIEHKEFTKLGGTRPIKVDVQIIAATNADLEQRTKEGTFRDDLYFRLNEASIWVPRLADRKEDIPLLVRHFIQKHGRYLLNTRLDVSGEDLAALTEHPWPGNVRELESTIKRWLALGKKPTHIQERPPAVQAKPSNAFHAAPSSIGDLFDESTAADRNEAERIRDTLIRFKWNRRKAAEALGMSYQTLRRRIERLGLIQRI